MPRKTGVETADGVWLATDVFLPPDAPDGHRPTVLIRTPYNRAQFRDGTFVHPFLDRGFAVVTQDVRGKYASTGDFVPFIHEREDGLATLDWLVAQPWSDGRVAMWGSSYLGFAALVLVPERHPALKTVFQVSGWLDGEAMATPGGATHLMLSLPWMLSQESERQRSTVDYDLDELFRHLPLSGALRSVGIESELWESPSKLAIPQPRWADPPRASVFHLTGWFDFVAPASLAVFRELAAVPGVRQRLVVGPWLHNQPFGRHPRVGERDFGAASVLGTEALEELAAAWFTRELRMAAPDGGAGTTTPVDIAPFTDAPVRTFVLGADEWRSFAAWPPTASRPRRWYLAPQGGLAEAPPPEPAPRPLPADPSRPVPTLGGPLFHLFAEEAGIRDQRPLEARPDVATYTTPAFTGPLTLTGPVRAVIHLSTTGRGADLVAKLTRVLPDGTSEAMAEGVVRRIPLEPARPVPLTVELGDVALELAPGQRLRLQLAGSSFPKYDRNPHTGEDAFQAAKLMAVDHTLHASTEHPSHLEITVLDATHHNPTRGE